MCSATLRTLVVVVAVDVASVVAAVVMVVVMYYMMEIVVNSYPSSPRDTLIFTVLGNWPTPVPPAQAEETPTAT